MTSFIPNPGNNYSLFFCEKGNNYSLTDARNNNNKEAVKKDSFIGRAENKMKIIRT
jgi:hypothetical protein